MIPATTPGPPPGLPPHLAARAGRCHNPSGSPGARPGPGSGAVAGRRRGQRAVSAAGALELRAPHAPGDPADPLLRQVMPLAAELAERPGFGADPLAERAAFKAPGLLQKYQGRALLITTGACAVHCRYCFRREFPYAEQIGSRRAAPGAGRHRARTPSIEEVILSGGDPLEPQRRAAAGAHRAAARRFRTCGACGCTPACRWCCRRGSMPACSRGCATCPGRWPWSCTATTAMKSMTSVRAACARLRAPVRRC